MGLQAVPRLCLEHWKPRKQLQLLTQLVGFFTLGLECSPCFEGVCLHECWSKSSTSPTQIHCCCNYSNAIYHCKSSDYSTEWLLMNHSSDSFPAQRVMGKYWWIALTFTSARQTGCLVFTANHSRALQKLFSCVYYVRCSVPNCSEKLVCNHSHCLQSCWEEIDLRFWLVVSCSSK